MESTQRRTPPAPAGRPAAAPRRGRPPTRPRPPAPPPLLGPLDALERGTFSFVTPALRSYFRDVADHLKLVNEEVAAQRDLLTTVLEANMAVISVEQNEVVRRISAWAAIITVPTFIASFYGMNFKA